MDQIHEELKYPAASSDVNYDDPIGQPCNHGNGGIVAAAAAACDTESEAEYETCDSGVNRSSEKKFLVVPFTRGAFQS